LTVAELIEQLQDINPNMPVWMASDEEGNSYAPLYEVALFNTKEVEDNGDGDIEVWVIENMDEVAEKHDKVLMLWP
jgi:hypothetical protein